MTPPPDPAILERNLDALKTTHPELAARLVALDISAFNPTPALTRDGRASFRLTPPDAQARWLGRSSIPGVRAVILIEQFDPGQGNVLLPGFGEGTEVETLLATLESNRAVFVWEPELVRICLNFALRDFASALSAGRLVLVHCPPEELASTLARWLSLHPSVQCPGRIMAWPWQSQAELAQYRIAVETAWQQSAPAK